MFPGLNNKKREEEERRFPVKRPDCQHDEKQVETAISDESDRDNKDQHVQNLCRLARPLTYPDRQVCHDEEIEEEWADLENEDFDFFGLKDEDE